MRCHDFLNHNHCCSGRGNHFSDVMQNGLFALLAIVAMPNAVLSDDLSPESSIEARDVYLRIKDAADLPALERGQLRQIVVEPGDSVEPGQLLAEFDDVEAKLNLELAKIDLEIADKQYRESATVEIARATLQEARQVLSQARLEAEATETLAATDIGIRQATRDSEVSKGDLQRAITARKEFSSSVSEQQLVKLTLVRDLDLLKLEKAKLDQTVDQLRSQSRNAIVAQQEAAVQRLEHALQKAESEHATAALNLNGLQKQVAIAEARLERRKLKAPFSGVIVERLRSEGEWAEVGESVLRIIRMDVLYVEGYVSAPLIQQSFRGHKVLVNCSDSENAGKIDGTVVFVSPEIDSVSQQVLVRAEIPNPDLQFRPGQPAKMWIAP
jgi:multidrug efflux pump subunit AcrA (membrane-fusion protein)